MAQAVERVLFVHAHPDDETISTGGTIATLIDRGGQVTVLTCTRGELGEVIPADIAHLEGSPALADHRERELSEALRILGVTDHRYLGEPDARWPGNPPRRYLDSGMRWGAAGAEATDSSDVASLTTAEFGEVAADIAAVISSVEPHVVVSYDENGDYGHPDHLRAHEAARRASEVMGVPFWVVETGPPGGAVGRGAESPIEIDVSRAVDRKRRALEAHRSQVVVNGDAFALSNGLSAPIATVERFRLLRPPAPSSPAFRDLGRGSKATHVLAAALFGATTGFVMTAVNQATVPVGGLEIPWGIVVAVLAATALLVGLRMTFDSRLLPFVAIIAIVGLTAFIAAPDRGGASVLPANPTGYVWTFAPAIVATVVLLWPRDRRRAAGRIEGLSAPKGSTIP